jgi:acyl-coenzyme A synthetase/AMP-(fatty) acid ligase
VTSLEEVYERAGIDGLIRAQAGATPYAPAVVTERSSLTYAALVAAVDRLDALTAQVPAVRQAGCIGLSFTNPVTHLVATLFLLRLGKTQITVPPQVPAQWIELLAASGVQCILCDHRNPLPIDVPRAVIDPQSLYRAPTWPLAAAREIDAATPALLVPGSGTTGRPRLIEYSHGGLLACIKRDQRFRPIGPGSRHLSVTNIGFYTAKRRALGCLVAGGTIVLREQPVNTTDLCDRAAVDHLSVVVMQAEDMVASLPPEPSAPKLSPLSFSRMRWILVGIGTAVS